MNDILPNRFQPRIYFDETKLVELSDSIRKFGVIQPIVVRKINDKYEIIAGERRFKASELANKTTIPAIVVKLSDKDAEEIALLENVQRQELNAMEEAVSYKRILDMGYISQEDLSKKIGKPQSAIVNKTRLLGLDDEVQSALLRGKISERHARSLLRLTDKNLQVDMLHRVINERLTVKMLDDEIKKILSSNTNKIEYQSTTLKNNVSEPSINNISQSFIDSLFKNNESERGKKMDIDKIMNEAHDINESRPMNDISSLMKQEPSTQSVVSNTEPSPSENIELNSKFINSTGMAGVPTSEEVKPQTSTGSVTFDSIFNQSPVDVQPSNLQQTDNLSNQVSNDVSKVQTEPDNQVLPSPVSSQSQVFSQSQPTVNNTPMYHTIGSVNDTLNNNNNNNDNTEASFVSQSSVSIQKDFVDSNQSNDYNLSNIPNSDVIEGTNSQSIIPSQESSQPIQSQLDSNSLPVNNFKKVIDIVRNCSSQIENLGYYIDVDEVDLDDTYQITFKIEKK